MTEIEKIKDQLVEYVDTCIVPLLGLESVFTHVCAKGIELQADDDKDGHIITITLTDKGLVATKTETVHNWDGLHVTTEQINQISAQWLIQGMSDISKYMITMYLKLIQKIEVQDV